MATYNGQVTGGSLNLRASANTGASLLVQIPNNTQIVVSDYSGNSNWFCTTYSGKSGFVMKQYVIILSAVASRSCNVIGGSLNLRAYPSTSATSLIQIPNNTALTVQTHNSIWSSTTYNGNSGFVKTEFLSDGGVVPPAPSGDGTPTHGKVQCNDYITVRSTPSTAAPELGRIKNGQQVVYYAGEIHTSPNGSEFYRIDFDGIGYVLKQYIVTDASNRNIVSTFNYDAEAAVLYGYNHTLDNRSEYEPSNNNDSFGFIENGNCANFVSQCLCAGGLPMFNTWSRTITGVSSDSVSRYVWNHTNAARCALIAKGRLRKINCADVKKGDIIYNYDTAESNEYNRYDHVVIVAQDYNSTSGSCLVHGHTQNTRNYEKFINDTNHRCYRVVSPIKVEACEYQIDMPVCGNGGEAT